MNYFSTRDKSLKFSFKDIFLRGLAPGGGLFLPSEIKHYDKSELDKLSQLLEAVKQGKPYKPSDKYRFSIIKYPSTDPHTIKDIEFIKKTIKGMLSRLDNYMKKGENILIFCHKGRHRSVALCMLYQMYKYDINYITSYRIMKKIYISNFFYTYNFFFLKSLISFFD